MAVKCMLFNGSLYMLMSSTHDIHLKNLFYVAVLQYHRQQELLSSILKQQHSAQNMSQSSLLQRRQRPSTKEIPMQQTLGLPTLGISPRQSPLPPDAVSSSISSQGRIPSPLGLYTL